jgi:hypothetical protein
VKELLHCVPVAEPIRSIGDGSSSSSSSSTSSSSTTTTTTATTARNEDSDDEYHLAITGTGKSRKMSITWQLPPPPPPPPPPPQPPPGKKIVLVSCPEYGPDVSGGYTFPVFKSCIALAKRGKGIILGFFEKNKKLDEDAALWEDYGKAASFEEKTLLVRQMKWFSESCAQAKAATTSACQEGSTVVMACIAGGVVSQIKAQEMILIRAQVVASLAKMSYADVRVEIQHFNTYWVLEEFVAEHSASTSSSASSASSTSSTSSTSSASSTSSTSSSSTSSSSKKEGGGRAIAAQEVRRTMGGQHLTKVPKERTQTGKEGKDEEEEEDEDEEAKRTNGTPVGKITAAAAAGATIPRSYNQLLTTANSSSHAQSSRSVSATSAEELLARGHAPEHLIVVNQSRSASRSASGGSASGGSASVRRKITPHTTEKLRAVGKCDVNVPSEGRAMLTSAICCMSGDDGGSATITSTGAGYALHSPERARALHFGRAGGSSGGSRSDGSDGSSLRTNSSIVGDSIKVGGAETREGVLIAEAQQTVQPIEAMLRQENRQQLLRIQQMEAMLQRMSQAESPVSPARAVAGAEGAAAAAATAVRRGSNDHCDDVVCDGDGDDGGKGAEVEMETDNCGDSEYDETEDVYDGEEGDEDEDEDEDEEEDEDDEDDEDDDEDDEDDEDEDAVLASFLDAHEYSSLRAREREWHGQGRGYGLEREWHGQGRGYGLADGKRMRQSVNVNKQTSGQAKGTAGTDGGHKDEASKAEQQLQRQVQKLMQQQKQVEQQLEAAQQKLLSMSSPSTDLSTSHSPMLHPPRSQPSSHPSSHPSMPPLATVVPVSVHGANSSSPTSTTNTTASSTTRPSSAASRLSQSYDIEHSASSASGTYGTGGAFGGGNYSGGPFGGASFGGSNDGVRGGSIPFNNSTWSRRSTPSTHPNRFGTPPLRTPRRTTPRTNPRCNTLDCRVLDVSHVYCVIPLPFDSAKTHSCCLCASSILAPLCSRVVTLAFAVAGGALLLRRSQLLDGTLP